MRCIFFENVDFSIGEEGAVGTEYLRRAAAAGVAAASSLSSLKVEEVV